MSGSRFADLASLIISSGMLGFGLRFLVLRVCLPPLGLRLTESLAPGGLPAPGLVPPLDIGLSFHCSLVIFAICSMTVTINFNPTPPPNIHNQDLGSRPHPKIITHIDIINAKIKPNMAAAIFASIDNSFFDYWLSFNNNYRS